MTTRDNNNPTKIARTALKVDQESSGKSASLAGLDPDEIACLSPAEKLELEQAEAALKFLDQVRVDLAHLESDAGLGPQADASTATNFATLGNVQTQSPLAETLGRFQILELLGQGGFARVFLAQDPLLGRQVALKIPKPQCLASDEARRRFEREAKAAAVLSHPAIVPVFESGEIGPISYIASGYCPGETLASWFEQRNRKVDAATAARIVARLAEAVEHAHQRGVIHRDLKPANILVDNGSHGIAEQLRITDFGLAKQLDSDDLSLTVEGTAIGTPAYMSPEQARGMETVGPATDVYSLGVILYELLSSRLPIKKTNHLATLKAIEDEVVPSLRKMDHSIPRDLAAICFKCLNKSPSDRYSSAFELLEDLTSFIENRPVQARPVSQFRRLAQWYARNSALALALTFAFLSLAIGFAVSAWQWNRSNSETRRADRQRIEAVKAKAEAVASAENEKLAKMQAQTRLAQIEKGMGVLTRIFEDLDVRAIQESTEPLEAILAHRLINAGNQLVDESVGDPLLVAGMQTQLANTLISLGFSSDAIGLAEQSTRTRTALLGEKDPRSLASMYTLAESYVNDGQWFKAIPIHQKTLDLRMAELAPGAKDILVSMNGMAHCYELAGMWDKAIPLYEETIRLKMLDLERDHPSTLTSMNNLASVYRASGQLDKALVLFEETLRLRKAVLPEDHPDTLTSMNNLALSLASTNQLDKAMPLYEQTLEKRQAVLGELHPSTLTSMNNLAWGYRAAQQLDRALPLLEKTLELRMVKQRKDHPDTLTAMNNLASGYLAAGRFEDALPLYEEAMRLMKSSLGVDHPETLITMNNLATGYHRAGNLTRALALVKEAFGLMQNKLEEDHPTRLTTMSNLANFIYSAGQLEKALPLFERNLELTLDKLDEDHPDTLSRMNNLAACYRALGRYEEAIPLFQKTMQLRESKLGIEAQETLESKGNLGTTFLYNQQPQRAIPLLEAAVAAIERVPDFSPFRTSLRTAYAEANELEKFFPLAEQELEALRANASPGSRELASGLAGLGLDYLTVADFENAESVLRESLNIREKLGIKSWGVANTRSMLGASLLGLKDHADAEPLLVAGYQGLAEATIPVSLRRLRLTEALNRLVELYEVLGKPEEVARYKAIRRRLSD